MRHGLAGNRILVMRHLRNLDTVDGFAPFASTPIGIAQAIGKSKASMYPSLKYLCAAGMVKEVQARIRKPPLMDDGTTRRKTVWRCYFLTDDGRAFISARGEWSGGMAGRPSLGAGVEA